MLRNLLGQGEAVARLVSTLPADAAQLLLGQLDEALAERELLWHNVLSGTEDAMHGLPSPSLTHARGITPDDGDGDRLSSPPAWTRASIRGCFRRTRMRAPGGAHARLLELGDAEVDHTWMWCIEFCWSLRNTSTRHACAWAAPDPANLSPVLPASLDPWTLAPPTPLVALWARPHATTTRSHATAESCDCTAEIEVPGLISGTDLRPTSSGLGNYYTAFDISICSPHAQQAGSAQKQDMKPNLPITAHTSPLFSALQHSDRLERLWAASPRHVDRFALSR